MNKTILLALCLMAPAAFAGNSDIGSSNAGTDSVRFIESVSGEYRLESNDSTNACRGIAEDLQTNSRFRVVSQVNQKSDEFGKAGDLNVLFQMYYPNWKNDNGQIGKWYRIFDRSDFVHIDQGSVRKITALGVVSHKAGVSLKDRKIVHTVGQTIPLYGGSTGVQEMSFDAQSERMIYTYTINEFNGVGIKTGSMPAGRCVFIKVK